VRYSAVEDMVAKDKRLAISVICALTSIIEIWHVGLPEENSAEAKERGTVWYRGDGRWEEIRPYVYSSIDISLSKLSRYLYQ
jgi:hypothetical protein